jgi:hypothetical protein
MPSQHVVAGGDKRSSYWTGPDLFALQEIVQHLSFNAHIKSVFDVKYAVPCINRLCGYGAVLVQRQLVRAGRWPGAHNPHGKIMSAQGA